MSFIYLRLDLTKIGGYISYQDKNGLYQKTFPCYDISFQDLKFTRYHLDLQEENIASNFDPIEPFDLSLYRQLKDSLQIVYQNCPLFVHILSTCGIIRHGKYFLHNSYLHMIQLLFLRLFIDITTLIDMKT